MKICDNRILKSVCTWLSFLPSVELQQLVKSDWSWIKKLPISLRIFLLHERFHEFGRLIGPAGHEGVILFWRGWVQARLLCRQTHEPIPCSEEIIHRGRRSDSRVFLREPGSRQCARSQQARQPAVPTWQQVRQHLNSGQMHMTKTTKQIVPRMTPV